MRRMESLSVRPASGSSGSRRLRLKSDLELVGSDWARHKYQSPSTAIAASERIIVLRMTDPISPSPDYRETL
jgi:hypothetical protein